MAATTLTYAERAAAKRGFGLALVARTRLSRRMRRGACCAAIAVLVLTACSDASSAGGDGSMERADSSPSTPPAGSATPTPETVVDRAKEAALAAYRGMWLDMARAARTSNWRAGYLADHATGDALTAITGSLYADHRNGLVTRGDPILYPTVSSVNPPNDPTAIMIDDCGDSTNWLKYEEDTDQLADDEPGGRQAIIAEVKRQTDGIWQVTRFAVQSVGSC
ncbi:hypothetical protein ACTWP5_30865 [Streptomyces sp. 4N509B]|uniref:hypothetical protein n=1 Tax=Streptomyces sp. 4N509B TaxID=3457413 RepID=UPI003FD5168C